MFDLKKSPTPFHKALAYVLWLSRDSFLYWLKDWSLLYGIQNLR